MSDQNDEVIPLKNRADINYSGDQSQAITP